MDMFFVSRETVKRKNPRKTKFQQSNIEKCFSVQCLCLIPVRRLSVNYGELFFPSLGRCVVNQIVFSREINDSTLSTNKASRSSESL